MAASKKPEAEGAPAGFTLLELTVALAVLAVVSSAALRLQFQGFQAFERSTQVTEAVLLAQEKLAEVQLGLLGAGRGQRRSPAGGQLHWETAFGRTPYPGVRSVRVRVRAGERGPSIVEAVTYVAERENGARP